ncbi:MAG: hypothetical protein QM639_07350 [Rhodocyclaceae bacterium]
MVAVTILLGLRPAPTVACPYPTAEVAAAPPAELEDALELAVELALELCCEVLALLDDELTLLLTELLVDDTAELLALEDDPPAGDALPPSPLPPPHAVSAVQTTPRIRADFSPGDAAFITTPPP